MAQTTRALISTREHAKSFEGITASAKKHWECLGVLGTITEQHCWEIPGKAEKCQAA